MSVSVTLTDSQVFPAGVTVNAYLASSFPGQPPQRGQAPGGVPVVSSGVAGSSSTNLSGLAAEANYVAGAEVNGVWKYVRFRTPAEAVMGEGVTMPEVEQAIAAKTVPLATIDQLIAAAESRTLTREQIEQLITAHAGGGSSQPETIAVGVNGLLKAINTATFAAKSGVKLAREDIRAGKGSPRQESFGEEGVAAIERWLAKGEGYSALPIYNPFLNGNKAFRAPTAAGQYITLVQIEEDVTRIVAWMKGLGLKRLEFFNETYYQFQQLYTTEEYAKAYAAAHKICAAAGIELGMDGWVDTNEGTSGKGRVSTTLSAEAKAGATVVHLASVAGLATEGWRWLLIGEQVVEYTGISGTEVTLKEALAASHEKGAAVFGTGPGNFSQVAAGGGWCQLMVKALAGIAGAPAVPDFWTFHPYGQQTHRSTDGGTGEGESEGGWRTLQVFMDALRAQGIMAPVDVTEMGNKVGGQPGATPPPEMTAGEAREWQAHYIADAQAWGVRSIYFFQSTAFLEEAATPETLAVAIRDAARVVKSQRIVESVTIAAGGTNVWCGWSTTKPRACGAQAVGAAGGSTLVAAEPQEGGYVKLRAFARGSGAETTGETVLVSWWAER